LADGFLDFFAKAGVAGSNPVSRSILYIRDYRQRDLNTG